LFSLLQIRKSLFPPPPTRKRSRNEYRQQLLRKQSSQLDRLPSALSTKRPRSGTPDSQPSSLSSISSPKRRHIVDDNSTTANNPPSSNRPTRKHSLLSKHSAGESTDSDFNSDQDSDLASPRSASSSNRIGFLNKQSPRAKPRRKSSFAKVQQSATSSTGVRTFKNSSQSHDHDNSEPTTAVAELKYAAAPATAVRPLTVTNSNNSSLGYLATSPRKRCTPERRMTSPKRLKLDLAESPTSTNQPEPKPDNRMATIGIGGKLNNKLFKNVLCTGGPSDTDSSDSGQASKSLPTSSATQTTTSGFSSSSSQELGSPSFDSQETYCSELGDFATALPTRTASTGMLEQLMDRNVLFPSSLSRNASSLSDMALSQESAASSVDVTKSDLGMCMVCLSNPKDGAFVHKKKVHLCCCYKCANQIWRQRKTCPICNGKVTTVAKLFAH
jgi:Zinc finger, C3HC4 type (RING finger)